MDKTLNDTIIKLLATLETYGPKATNMVLALGQIEALRQIIIGAVAFCFLIVCFAVHRYTWKRSDFDKPNGFALMSLISFTGCGLSLGITLEYWLNIYAWIGLWRPEVFLAARFLGWV